MEQNEKKYFSTTELASLLGVSRIAIFKKIKKGEIKAKKKGRNYVIDSSSVPGLADELTPKEQKNIDRAVSKVVNEYGETLKLLASE
jgi:excisionase family DNA binding protein